jgi:hypothetical protein
LFIQVLPELSEKKDEVLIQEVTNDKLGNLRKADPDIFKKDSNGYARLCSCERQPLIIDDDEEAADWKNKSLSDEKSRVIGVFPPKKEERDRKSTRLNSSHQHLLHRSRMPSSA